jgi:ribosome-associated protein
MRAQLGQTRCGGAPTEPSIPHSLGGRREQWPDAYHRRIHEIRARDGVIRLGQLLKTAGFVDSGGEAKALLESGSVLVNGEPETRRGRQLHPGDTVAAGDEIAHVV